MYSLRQSHKQLALGLVLLSACSKDPAAGVPKAQVSPTIERTNTPTVPSGASQGPTVATTPMAPGALRVTPNGSTIGFVGSKVTGSHEGTFARFTGGIDLVENDPAKSHVRVDIEMNSVSVSDPKLTGHLKSPDFFDVATFPTASFDSVSITPLSGAQFTVKGKLSLHGITREITFPATITLSTTGVVVASNFTINRKDFGIVYPGMPDNLIRDEVVIKLDLHVSKT